MKPGARTHFKTSEFAADINRYLEHEPVLASPPSATYRARKFVRRHRAGVAAAAVVIVTLVSAATGMTAAYFREKREAERNAAIVAAFNAWTVDMEVLRPNARSMAAFMAAARQAITLQRAAFVGDPERMQRFLRTWLVLSQISHTNIQGGPNRGAATKDIGAFEVELKALLEATSPSVVDDHGVWGGFAWLSRPTGVVSGLVRGPSGQPVARALVQTRNQRTQLIEAVTLTDANGLFAMTVSADLAFAIECVKPVDETLVTLATIKPIVIPPGRSQQVLIRLPRRAGEAR